MAHNLAAAKRLRKELQNLERSALSSSLHKKKKQSKPSSKPNSNQNQTQTNNKNNQHKPSPLIIHNDHSDEDDVYLRPTNSKSILHWTALLRGPKDTPYENGVFQLSITCGTDYPLAPPSITFITRVFHPNVHFRSGDVCLDILKKEWSPAWGLQAACRAVLALLSDPDAESPLNCDAGNMIRGGDLVAFRSTARMYTVENAMGLEWPV